LVLEPLLVAEHEEDQHHRGANQVVVEILPQKTEPRQELRDQIDGNVQERVVRRHCLPWTGMGGGGVCIWHAALRSNGGRNMCRPTAARQAASANRNYSCRE